MTYITHFSDGNEKILQGETKDIFNYINDYCLCDNIQLVKLQLVDDEIAKNFN